MKLSTFGVTRQDSSIKNDSQHLRRGSARLKYQVWHSELAVWTARHKLQVRHLAYAVRHRKTEESSVSLSTFGTAAQDWRTYSIKKGTQHLRLRGTARLKWTNLSGIQSAHWMPAVLRGKLQQTARIFKLYILLGVREWLEYKVRPCSTFCRVLTKLLANIYKCESVSRNFVEKAYCTVIIFNL
jgi:hypothetical protein